MTECERLIQQGTLNKEFLEPEERCDYFISSEMKKLWALQIDLVKKIEDICKKHGLTYFVIGGGTIGAIRHGGCIPWDDDIDVALKRPDYNKFIDIAEQELETPYFLQTPRTDRYFYRRFIVLRNSNSTCIQRGDQKIPCNNGACIHIFPLDGYADNFVCNRLIKTENFRNAIGLNYFHGQTKTSKKFKRRIMKILTRFFFPLGFAHHYESINKKCEKLYKKYHDKIGLQYVHSTGFPHKFIWDEKCFSSVLWMPFEYTELPLPVGYDEMLRHQFGDYMQFPPIEKRGDKHEFEIAPDVPYQIYCAEKYGIKY